MPEGKTVAIIILTLGLIISGIGFGQYYLQSSLQNQKISFLEADPSTITHNSTITSTTISLVPFIETSTDYATVTSISSSTLISTKLETVTSTTSSTLISTTLETVTTTSTSTTISTTSIYPVPDNVTVFFTNISGTFDYSVTAGSLSFSGSDYNQNLTIPITPIFQGNVVSVSAYTTASVGCNIGEQVTAIIYLNNQVVAQGTTLCTGNQINISYTV